MKFYLLGLVMALSGAAIHAAPSKAVAKKSDEPTYCEQAVIYHGMMSRAQFECGYSQYNEELIVESGKCIKHELGDEYGTTLLKIGMSDFDHVVGKMGKQETCKVILKRNPNTVRKWFYKVQINKRVRRYV